MVGLLRQLGKELSLLALTCVRVLKDHGSLLLLLFTLGALGYWVTVLATGVVAQLSAWAVIPLMGAGCLIQIIVALAAYRTSILAAEARLEATRLPSAHSLGEDSQTTGTFQGHGRLAQLAKVPLLTLVSTLIVPFIAAYSAFGFFESYARSGTIAVTTMGGTFASTSFLNRINPLESTTTFLISLGAFLVLWGAAWGVKLLANKTGSWLLRLVYAFITASSTFLVLLSFFRIVSRAKFWLQDRQFLAWIDQGVRALGDLIHINLPQILAEAWAWITEQAWPLFWNALSEPVLWLTVIALVGGMQFLSVETLWSRIRTRAGLRATRKSKDNAITDEIKDNIEDLGAQVLPFLHTLSVVLRSGGPFLGAVILSYAVIKTLGNWATFGVERLIGGVAQKYVMLVAPPASVIGMVIIPGLHAVLLATAYIRLRHKEAEPRGGVSVRGFLVGLACVGLAVGVYCLQPDSGQIMVGVKDGTPAQVMGNTIQVEESRAGFAIQGQISGYYGTEPLESQGVFVVLRVTSMPFDAASLRATAQVGEVTYAPWSYYGALSCAAGFMCTQDIIFDVPVTALDDLRIHFTYTQWVTYILEIGEYAVAADIPTQAVLLVDETVIVGVP